MYFRIMLRQVTLSALPRNCREVKRPFRLNDNRVSLTGDVLLLKNDESCSDGKCQKGRLCRALAYVNQYHFRVISSASSSDKYAAAYGHGLRSAGFSLSHFVQAMSPVADV